MQNKTGYNSAYYYYIELVNVIRQRQYKDVPFKLRKIGNTDEQYSGNAQYNKIINDNKRGCMRGILYIYASKEDYGWTDDDFITAIKGAHVIGIDWPELSVLEDAITTSKVTETMRVSSGHKSRENRLAELKEIFEHSGNDVFDRVTELYIAFSILEDITQHDVDTILKTYKRRIVKDVLDHLKHGTVDIDISNFVRVLREMGATWPELDIISTAYDNPDLQLDEAQRTQDEIIRDKFDYSMFDGIAALRIYGHQLADFPEYAQRVQQHKKSVVRSLLKLCKNNNASMAKFIAEDLKTVGVDWPELDIILDAVNHEHDQFFGTGSAGEINEAIDDASKYNLSGMLSSIKYDEPREMVLFLSQLSWPWQDLPNIASKLNPHKRFIVKALLDFLRDETYEAEPYDTVKDCLAALEKMNFHSLELTILRDALGLNNELKESYRLGDGEIEQYKADLMSDIYGKQYDSAIDIIPDIIKHKNIGDVSRIIHGLKKHKRGIMHALLGRIKLCTGTEITYYKPLLAAFETLGIAWPELDILKNTIDATSSDNSNTSITENDEHGKLRANEYKADIIKAVLQDDIDLVLESLAEFGWTTRENLGDITDLNRVLQHNKKRIMKGILDHMRELGSDDIIYIIPQILQGLINAGIAWPDLELLDNQIDLMNQDRLDESHSMIAREIRYTLMNFYEDLETQSYVDAVECLNELYHYKVYDTAECDRINTALQHNKRGIVKRLLRYMQLYSSDEIAHFISLTIKSLRAFGIDWPELETIAPVADNEPLAEALGSPLGNIVFGIQNALRQGNDRVVSHRVIDLWRGDADQRQRASEMLLDVKQLVLSWVERHLGSDDILAVQDGLNLVQVLPPSEDWADIPMLLKKYKKNIIKYLLKCMQHEEFDIVSYRIPILRDWGITWPDLDILKPGADELEKKKARDSQLDEADSRADFSTVFRNRSDADGGHRFLLTADEYVDHIRKLLQHGYKDNEAVVELSTIGRKRRGAITNWPELAAVIDKYKNKLFRILLTQFEHAHHTHRIMDLLGALNAIGVHWPEIEPLIKKHKRKIIRLILDLINEDADTEFVQSQIKTLKSYGITWPELDILADGFLDDKLTENDRSSTAQAWPDDVRSMLMDMLEDDNLGIALYHIEQFHLDIYKLPELKDYLNKRKRRYMKVILDNFKHGDDFGAVEQWLGRLELSKINWPDLEVIRDGLNKTYDPGTDSNAP